MSEIASIHSRISLCRNGKQFPSLGNLLISDELGNAVAQVMLKNHKDYYSTILGDF